MKSIRRGVFETNSSSTHSLTMCSADEYDAWQKGNMLLDEDTGSFVRQEDVAVYNTKHKYCELKTWSEYWEDEYLEPFEESYSTKGGEKVIAFGKYGYDG